MCIERKKWEKLFPSGHTTISPSAAPSSAPTKPPGKRRCGGQAFVPSESSLPSNTFHRSTAIECRDACEANVDCRAWKWKKDVCQTFDRETMLVSRDDETDGSVCRDETFAQPFDGFDAQVVGDADWDDSVQILNTSTWTSSAAACAESCQKNIKCRSFAYNSETLPGVCTLLNEMFDTNSTHTMRKNGSSFTVTANRLPS